MAHKQLAYNNLKVIRRQLDNILKEESSFNIGEAFGLKENDDFISIAWDTLKGSASDVATGISKGAEIASDAFEATVDVAQEAMPYIATATKNVAETATTVAKSVASGTSKFAGRAMDLGNKGINIVSKTFIKTFTNVSAETIKKVIMAGSAMILVSLALALLVRPETREQASKIMQSVRNLDIMGVCSGFVGLATSLGMFTLPAIVGVILIICALIEQHTSYKPLTRVRNMYLDASTYIKNLWIDIQREMKEA